MEEQDGRTRARLAVTAEMASRGWSPAKLAMESGADPGTVGDFLNGKRWIKIPTQGKIERAFGWPAGAISSIEAGLNPTSVGASADDAGVAMIKARKPANMSDEDFKRLLAEYEEEIEWKLDRAARER